MSRILIIDPGKGWGQFVSKMYCYQKLANHLNSKIIFLTKKSTQAKYYLKSNTFCEDVLYIDEPKKELGIFLEISNFFLKILKKLINLILTLVMFFTPL